MPNFQFYLQMYSARDQQQYQTAMANAYRDLMVEYKEQAMVRNILLEQMSIDKQLRAKVMSSISKAKKEGDMVEWKELTNAWKGYNSMLIGYQESNKAREDKRRKEIENLFELPPGDLVGINRHIRELGFLNAGKQWDTSTSKGLEQALKALRNDPAIQGLEDYTSSYKSQYKKDSFISQYGTSLEQATGIPIDVIAQVLTPGSVIVDRKTIERTKKEMLKETFESTPIPKQLQDYLLILDIGQEQFLESVLSKDMKETTTATATGQTGQIGETPGEDLAGEYKLPTPTIEEIRERATDYYAPFASKQFQREVGFRPPSRRQQRKTAEQQTKEKAKKDAPAKALAELPGYAGKIFKSAPQIEGIVDLEDEEVISNGGLATKWTMTLLEAGKDDLTSAMQKIEAQKDWGPEEVQEAYSILGRDLMRKHRKKKEIEPPSLEELMISPSRMV